MITIASFNIQVFGPTKAGKPEVVEQIAEIVSLFDIVAIQEIRDSSTVVETVLQEELEKQGHSYNYVMGERLGRTSSKEEYAYFYNPSRVKLLDTPFTYDDVNDDFHREPFIARFQAIDKPLDFFIVQIHVDPDEAVTEIQSLPEVYLSLKESFPMEKDVVILGDFNADCDYFDEQLDWPEEFSESYFYQIIQNEEDTNLASRSCTYDRILITAGMMNDYTSKYGVYRFDDVYELTYDQAKTISDHYPVWATFHTTKDND